MPAALARLTTVVPMLRRWSTTASERPCAAASASTRSIAAASLATPTLKATEPPARTQHALCASLPTSKPTKASYGPSNDCMVYPPSQVGRPEACPRHPHYRAAKGFRQVPISRLRRAVLPPVATPPGPSAEAGAEGHPGEAGRRPRRADKKIAPAVAGAIAQSSEANSDCNGEGLLPLGEIPSPLADVRKCLQ